jgi:hypothetical protein
MKKSALLFYQKLIADLRSIGYVLTPYDPCVANKMINGKQMTICWHVDDLFIGRKDHKVVSDTISSLQNQYETPDKPLKATCGPTHDYLGTNIDFSTPMNVSYDMIPYLKKVITEFPPKNMGVASTPAADHLYKFVLPPKPTFFLNPKQLLITILPLNSSFSLGSVATFKLRTHSLLLG